MNKLVRLLKHRWLDISDTVRAVPDDMAERLARRVAASEGRHSGEVRLCVEASLPLSYLWRVNASTPLATIVRERALAWFGRLRIWDTEYNNGVLIYLLLADRDVEIVADRGVHARLGQAVWEAVCQEMEAAFRQGKFEEGVIAGIRSVGRHLAQHYPPADGSKINELPDRPVLI